MKKKSQIKNPELVKAVGKETHLKLIWKDWKKELPKVGEHIYVILKFDDGYMTVTAEYYDEIIPASKEGSFPETRWRTVKFHEFRLPDIYLHHELAKKLVAWAAPRVISPLLRNAN